VKEDMTRILGSAGRAPTPTFTAIFFLSREKGSLDSWTVGKS